MTGTYSPNTKHVSSYLKERTFEKLEKYRDQQGINRSEAIEELLEQRLSKPKERTIFETQFDRPKAPSPVLPDVSILDRLYEKVMSECGRYSGNLGMNPLYIAKSVMQQYIAELKQHVYIENTPEKVRSREIKDYSVDITQEVMSGAYFQK